MKNPGPCDSVSVTVSATAIASAGTPGGSATLIVSPAATGAARGGRRVSIARVGVIGIAAYLTMRAPDKGQRVGPPPRPIAALKAADVKELDITSNKEHVNLKHDGTSWKITSPGAWNADQQMAKTAADELEKIGFGDLVTETESKFAEMEVDGDKAAHVIAKDAAGNVNDKGVVKFRKVEIKTL